MSGADTICANFWKRLIEAAVSESTWITAAAASESSSGSIQSVTGTMFRLNGKSATRVPTRSASSPCTPLKYSWTAVSRLFVRQLPAVSFGLITLTLPTSVRLRSAEILSGQSCKKARHRDRREQKRRDWRERQRGSRRRG